MPGFLNSDQLSLNKFLDPSTPSMRKGRDGGEKNGGGMKKKRMMKIVATNVIASRKCQPTGTPSARAN